MVDMIMALYVKILEIALPCAVVFSLGNYLVGLFCDMALSGKIHLR